ncbi:MFS transporter [Candidatus Woesearchaeota archaeon]|nr:MFS transporter [Candidatus Woesearchaeota archaeon]
MMPRIPQNVKWLSFVSFLSDISAEMTFPILPLFMASVIGMTTSQIGIVEGIGLSTVALLKVFAGYASDKWHTRKPFIVTGYTIPALAKPIIAISTSWWHVLLYRFLDRTGKGIRDAPRDALIAATTKKKQRGRMFGFHRAWDTVGAIIGSTIAAIILFYIPGAYRLIFWISIIPITLAAFSVKTFVKEGPITHEHQKFTFRLRDLNKAYKRFMLVSFVFGTASISYSFFLLTANNRGIMPALIPVLYIVYNIMYATLSYPAGKLSDNIGRKNVLLLGYTLMLLTVLGFALTPTPHIMWILFALYGSAIAFTDAVSNAFVADLVPFDKRATALGLQHTILGIAILPGNILFGYITQQFSASTAFYVLTGLVFIATVLLWCYVKEK